MLKLSEIIGNGVAIRILRSALTQNKPASAYLFAGPPGVGKRTTAYAFAMALLCEKGGDDACGVCGQCRKVMVGSHPDLTYVEPIVRDRKVKQEIDIESIREIIRKLSFRPYEGKRKILIIDQVEKMNLVASNAFLKTLEEPPGDTVIILTTENMSSLLLTILSRLQKVRFMPLKFEEILRFATERAGLHGEQAEAYAALSKGAPGMMSENAIEKEKETRSFALALLGERDAKWDADIMKMADKIDRSKEKALVYKVLESFVELLADLVKVKTKGKCDSLMNKDIVDELFSISPRFSRRKLLRAWDVSSELVRTRRWNINPFLIISLLALELKR
ncbi:DNA polymerase III delta prime subunit [hydrothermal vent metagenome]|uniref:DNA polymerase III delta prime subunit n=1 Tax=hydrothermal vent metagenome TaxID=652676 RepID=A0A3B1BKC1_9ZZZZ